MSSEPTVGKTSLAGPTPTPEAPAGKAYRGAAMEGSIARWYARTRGTGSQIAEWRSQAERVARDLAPGAEILEVAPGPGYFALELARLGRYRVTGLDVSHTFVEIATENARREGLTVSFRQGDAAAMPFPAASFDLVLCQAAFKNFSRPQTAVNEVYRVLRPGGTALIEDMRREATNEAIDEEVRGMMLGSLRAWMTRRALRSLRRRAYTVDQFRGFAAASPFGSGQVETSRIGVELRLRRPLSAA